MDNLKNKYVRIYMDTMDGMQTTEGLCTGVGDGFLFIRTRNGNEQCFPVVKISRVIILKLDIGW